MKTQLTKKQLKDLELLYKNLYIISTLFADFESDFNSFCAGASAILSIVTIAVKKVNLNWELNWNKQKTNINVFALNKALDYIKTLFDASKRVTIERFISKDWGKTEKLRELISEINKEQNENL